MMNESSAQPMDEAVNEAIVLTGLAKRYGRAVALDGVDLTVKPGDIYGFLGRNGAGKSTTIKILAGLVRPDRGSLRMLGNPQPGSHPATRQRVGFLIENPAFFPHLNARDNLLCHWILRGGKRKVGLREVEQCLDWVDLKEAAHRKVGGYSTGMGQRLGLAQAFLGDPELIILDEPLNGLDPEGILHMRGMIRKWAAERGTTFFISSHILAEVEQLCNRVGFIARGKTVAEGTLEELGALGRVNLTVSHPDQILTSLARKWPDMDPRLLDDRSLSLNLEGDRIPELVRFLVSQGEDIHAVGRRPRSLEEIFMDRTRRQE